MEDTRLSPRERDILYMKYRVDDGPFPSFCQAEFAAHGDAIRALSASKARWECHPNSNILMVRRRPITAYTVDEVLATIPDSYEGKAYESGPFSNEPFRLWHCVRHGPIRTPDDFTVLWSLIGRSKGIRNHEHALFAFRVPLYAHCVQQMTLADEVSPMHHSVNAAIRYITNQSVSTTQQGAIQWTAIHRSDRDRPHSVYAAAAEGEPPDLLNVEASLAAVNNYRNWLIYNPSTVAPIRLADSDESVQHVTTFASNTHRQAFFVDYEQLLAPFFQPPPTYGTHSVVFIRRVQEADEHQIVNRAGWVCLPDVVFYSLSPTTRPPFIALEPQAQEK